MKAKNSSTLWKQFVPGIHARLATAAFVLACALASAPSAAWGDVQALTSWTTGTTHAAQAGTNRLLIFTAGMENNGDQTITSVAYGGQAMTQVVTAVAGTGYRTRAYIFYLDEAGIAAATNSNFVVNWTSTPSQTLYAARMYENVDQSNPIRDFDSASTNSSSPNPITTPSMTVLGADLVVAAAQCGNANSYTWNNGFAEGVDFQSGSTCQHSTADKAITTDGTQIASATNSGPNRQVIVAAVLQRDSVPTPNPKFILSTTDDATLGGLSFGDDDLVEDDPNSDTATMYFDGGSLFSATDEDINAVHVMPDGNIVLSTTDDATLGGLSFGDDDLVVYDPVTDTATLLFDGGNLFSNSDEDIDAVCILDNGHIVLSTRGNATLGGSASATTTSSTTTR